MKLRLILVSLFFGCSLSMHAIDGRSGSVIYEYINASNSLLFKKVQPLIFSQVSGSQKSEYVTPEGLYKTLPIIDMARDPARLERFSPVNEGMEEILSLDSGAAYDAAENKLYVQFNVAMNIDREALTRKPLNLSLVIDISRSMGLKDNTKKSRLDWVKEAVTASLANMDEKDIISIAIFDDKVETLVAPQYLLNKKSIFAKVNALQPRDFTDLYLGIERGFDLIKKLKKDDYENRVLLLSDTWTNTGYSIVDIEKLVLDAALNGIGFTAIGIGEDFNTSFIGIINKARGGNSIFVHSGEELLKFFQEFKFLVTPIAFNFSAQCQFDGKKLELVATYGIPGRKHKDLENMFEVGTLFLVNKHSRAMVLEFDVKE